jgi:hypothetical protein
VENAPPWAGHEPTYGGVGTHDPLAEWKAAGAPPLELPPLDLSYLLGYGAKSKKQKGTGGGRTYAA